MVRTDLKCKPGEYLLLIVIIVLARGIFSLAEAVRAKLVSLESDEVERVGRR